MTSSVLLASGSASRKAMLGAAGVGFDIEPADIDEAAITQAMRLDDECPRAIGRALAEAKALSVSTSHPGRWVVGSDSMISVNGQLFDKPMSRTDAAAHLRVFSEKVIVLDSSVALARDGQIVDWASDDARLEVRALSDSFIEAYLDSEWPAIAACVGCFRIEARGVQLFENIIGNHFTILGMPLLPLLAMLRTHGVIAA
jgi:septum formation protein